MQAAVQDSPPRKRSKRTRRGSVKGPCASFDARRGGFPIPPNPSARPNQGEGSDEEEYSVRAKWRVVEQPADIGGYAGKTAIELISHLSQGPRSNLDSPECQEWIMHMKKMIEGRMWKEIAGVYVTNDLLSLVRRVSHVEHMKTGVEYLAMMSKIELAAKIQRYATVLLFDFLPDLILRAA